MASRCGSGTQSGDGASKHAGGTVGTKTAQPTSKSTGGAGGSQAGKQESHSAKPITDYAIHKGYGGTQKFMHAHGLRMWNPEDVDTMHAITNEYKAELQAEADANARTATGDRGPNPKAGHGTSRRR